jgi:glycine C-acetyltransferase
MVDVAHDLGCLGPDGRGLIGAQGMTGKVDVVMGSFSKTFASNGGFVACNQRSVKEYLRYYARPAPSPTRFRRSRPGSCSRRSRIVDSKEGDQLRESLMNNIRLLRELLHGTSFETYGDPSPIVCVKMGHRGARPFGEPPASRTRAAREPRRVPAVPKGQARFRMQVMANHSSRDIIDAVHRLSVARAEATQQHDGAPQRLDLISQASTRW